MDMTVPIKVHHKEYGDGEVIKTTTEKIYVKFSGKQLIFPYPAAFEKGYLTASEILASNGEGFHDGSEFLLPEVKVDSHREVVLDAVFLFDGSIDVGLRAVIVGVVFGHEGMPPARLRGVLLRGASRQDCKSYEKHRNKGAATEPQLTENLGDVMFWVHDSIVKTAWETKIQGACFFNYRAASETRPSPDRALECLGV